MFFRFVGLPGRSSVSRPICTLIDQVMPEISYEPSQPADRSVSQILGMFAKFWQPGTVKTRLAATIGDNAACDVYQTFVRHLLVTLSQSAHQRIVVYSPPHRADDWAQALGDIATPGQWQLSPQCEGDLGERMRAFFEGQFSDEASISSASENEIADSSNRRVVVIGADTPQLTTVTIDDAFAALDNHDVVIGPSTDGGYYLIGMRDQCHDLFSDISWSAETVLNETLDRARSLSLTVKTLPAMTDVDQLDELHLLRQLLVERNAAGADERDNELMAAIDQAYRVQDESGRL